MSYFYENMQKEFEERGESELFDDLQHTYRDLTERKLLRIDYPIESRTNPPMRLKVNCYVTRQVLLHRATYLFDATFAALRNKNAYALALCIQGHYESTATIGYLYKRITSYQHKDISLDDFEDDVFKQIAASKYKSKTDIPDTKNIMTQLDFADKVVDRKLFKLKTGRKAILRDNYEFLSEFAHPNFHSNSIALDVKKGSDSVVFRYDFPLRDIEFSMIGYLSISNEIFVWLFDKFGECVEKIC